MKSIARLLLVFFTLVCSSFAKSQGLLPIGQWKSHLPNSSCHSIAVAGSKVYAGDVGTFFSYDIGSSSIKTLSKVDGFSQTNISEMGYSASTQTLVIAYANSQIDLLQNGVIYTVNDIYDANISGSKAINHLCFVSNQVFISTDFGLIVYNLSSKQITGVYQYFDADGLTRNVNSSAYCNDSIFVATSSGLYVASNSSQVNKLDYHNWSKISPVDSTSSQVVFYVSSLNNELYVLASTYFMTYANGGWTYNSNIDGVVFGSLSAGGFIGMVTLNNTLYILQSGAVFAYVNGVCTRVFYDNDASVSSVDIDGAGKLWVGTENKGLLTNKFSPAFTSIKTDGIGFNAVFNLAYNQGTIIAVSGGYDNAFTQLGNLNDFSVYQDNAWKNYNWSLGNIPFCYDLCTSKFNPVSNKYYFSSYGNGMLEWDQLKNNFNLYNYRTPGCPLRTCTLGDFCTAADPGGNYCRVPDLAVDSKGSVWVLNTPDPNPGNATSPSLYKYTIDKVWSPISWSGIDPWDSYSYSFTNDNQYYNSLIYIDKNDTKWIGCRAGGVFVYNESKSSLPRYLQYAQGSIEEICGTYVNCITSDLEGGVWIGTDNGVCYFSDPSQVFANTAVKASLPVYNNYALLNGVAITAIDVDGSNRKWIGTANAGVWLFSSDGSKQIYQFNDLNKYLPSQNIVDVKVNQVTGEVFIATDQGLMSYGGNAILGTNDNSSSVIVYPNPVTKDFDGYLAISGLANSSIVKITDVSGKLVFETTSQGSLASWNVKDYTGRRPQAGIYLVFSSKSDGTEALVSKIAIID